jgi:hypothetical protein
MTNPTPAAALLVTALLAGSVVGGWHDSATAGQAPAPTLAAVPPVPPPPSESRGRAYLFRGFAGMVFSRGTDKLTDRIKQAGFTATVNEAVMCPNIIKDAIHDYRLDPAPIFLIGHSVGGACAIALAEALNDEQIPVSLLVTTEPARISHDVPPNVARFINLFQSDSVLGGVDIKPGDGFHGHYATFDLVKHKEILHVNMEKADFLHDQVMGKILQAAPTVNADGQARPLRFVVPEEAAIDLWDSGVPVTARAGDTLQTLATFYRVPLWSLTQVNQVPDDVPLIGGEQVIIPRHLDRPVAPNIPPAPAKTSRRRSK